MTLIWLASLGLCVRAHFRSDAVDLVLPGRHYVRLNSDDGRISVQHCADWPSETNFRWMSGVPADRPVVAPGDWDTIFGPQIWGFDQTQLRSREWRKFALVTGAVQYITLAGQIDMEFPTRGFDPRTFWRAYSTQPMAYVSIGGPVWAPAAFTSAIELCALAPAARRRIQRSRRRRRGRCIRCGYDRRHSPERCPECGAAA
jgi:hypothetical protein